MTAMAEKESDTSKASMGPSVVLGLVGAVVVLLLLGAAVWGVGKIVTKIREGREEEQEEETAEEAEGDEEVAEEEVAEGEAAEEEAGGEVAEEEGEETVAEEDVGEINEGAVSEESEEAGEEGEEETSQDSEQAEEVGGIGVIWTANDYKEGDIKGGTYTVVWGDTLWEIAEGRYGSGFEWGRIRDANLDKVGYLPNGSRALIFPGQVLTLP